MNYYCEFFKEFKETTIQSILEDFSEKRIDKEECLEKIVNYVCLVANAADDTVLKENFKKYDGQPDELKVYKKAYANVCDRLEFYERRMFPLTAVSIVMLMILKNVTALENLEKGAKHKILCRDTVH